MNLGLVLSLLEKTVGLVGGELKLRYEKDLIKYKKEYHEEMSKPDSERSDLTLNRILFNCETISRAIIKSGQN